MSTETDIDLPSARVRAFSPEGVQVLQIQVGDVESETPLGFFLLPDGNIDGAFRIDAGTGDLEVNNPNALDPDAHPRFEMAVEVTDGEDKAVVGVTIEVVKRSKRKPLADGELAKVTPGLQKLRNVFESLDAEIAQGSRPIFAGLNLDNHGLLLAGIATSGGLPTPFVEAKIDILDREGQSVIREPILRKSGEEGEFGAEISPFLWSSFATPLTIQVAVTQAGWGSQTTKIKALSYIFEPEKVANSDVEQGVVGRVLRPE
ncbi:MAG: cadherin repeat domain-containing protein [Verrucomicrobiota bacterium]